MFLLFGLTTRRSTRAGGDFWCPKEGTRRRYLRERSRRWFTLFFIPVLPLGQGREWERCTSCGIIAEPGVTAPRAPRAA